MTVTTEKSAAIEVEFTHEELSVMQDVLGRVQVGVDASFFAIYPALATALEKCMNAMMATRPRPMTEEDVAAFYRSIIRS